MAGNTRYEEGEHGDFGYWVEDNLTGEKIHNDDVVILLNEKDEQIKELQNIIDTIQRQCEPFRIPLTLTAFIPTEENCKRYYSCYENHTTNAQSYGQSKMANKILKIIPGVEK